MRLTWTLQHLDQGKPQPDYLWLNKMTPQQPQNRKLTVNGQILVTGLLVLPLVILEPRLGVEESLELLEMEVKGL